MLKQRAEGLLYSKHHPKHTNLFCIKQRRQMSKKCIVIIPVADNRLKKNKLVIPVKKKNKLQFYVNSGSISIFLYVGSDDDVT